MYVSRRESAGFESRFVENHARERRMSAAIITIHTIYSHKMHLREIREHVKEGNGGEVARIDKY